VGKSSLVCAMCLGLGGSINDMERHKRLEDFIRKQADRAEIHITLQGNVLFDSKNVKISRILTRSNSARTSCRDDWLLNDQPTSAEDISKILQGQFHIQMDNICMFLPQEIVKRFAERSPVRLLRDFERAIDVVLYDRHEKLIQEYKVLQEIARNQSTYEKERSLISSQLQQLQQAQERYREFQEKTRLKDLMKQKLFIVRANSQRKQIDEMKLQMNVIVTSIQALDVELQTPKKELQLAEKAYQDAKLVYGSKLSALKAKQGEIDASDRQFFKSSGAESVISKLFREIRGMADMKTAYEEEYKAAKDEHRRAKEEYENVLKRDGRSNNEITASIKDLEKDLATHTKTMRECETSIRSLNENIETLNEEINTTKMLLEKSKDVTRMRLECMEKSPFLPLKQAWQAYNWRKQHSARFASPNHVFGPLILDVLLNLPSIPPSDPRFTKLAAMVENSISASSRLGFLATNVQDRNVLYEIEPKVNLSLMSLDDVQAKLNSFRALGRQGVSDSFLDRLQKELGCRIYRLEDVIEVPDPVLALLYFDSQIHRFLLADSSAAVDNYSTLLERSPDLKLPPGFSLLSHSRQISSKRSVYDGSISSEVKGIRTRPELLHFARDEAEVARLSGQLKAQQDQLALLNQRMIEAHELSAKTSLVKMQCSSQLQQLKALLHNRERKRLDVEEAAKEVEAKREQLASRGSSEENLKNAYTRLRQKQLEFVREQVLALPKLVEAYMDLLVEVSAADLFVEQASSTLKEKKSIVDQIEQRKSQLKIMHSSDAAALKVAEGLLKSMQRDADNIPDLVREELSRRSAELPETVEDLEAEIGAVTKILEMRASREVDFERIKELQSKLEVLDQRCGSSTSSYEMRTAQYDRDFGEFSKLLESKVASISGTFRNSMESLSRKGSITVSITKDAISTAMLSINVAFRPDAPLTPLSSSNSGGEQSLSTMLFLLSMQPFTPLPFRLVDEINQGLDATFERTVLESLLSKTSASVSGKQLFIFTPKLMTDLSHVAHMRSLVIFNGPEVGTTVKSVKGLTSLFLNFCEYASSLHEDDLNGSFSSRRNAPLANVSHSPPDDRDQERSDTSRRSRSSSQRTTGLTSWLAGNRRSRDGAIIPSSSRAQGIDAADVITLD
jgi:structural maintenance of chromosomes protein 5